jgi:hypothetical protein
MKGDTASVPPRSLWRRGGTRGNRAFVFPTLSEGETAVGEKRGEVRPRPLLGGIVGPLRRRWRRGKRQVFWFIPLPNAFPPTVSGACWRRAVIAPGGSGCRGGWAEQGDIQQRDCTGFSPVSLFGAPISSPSSEDGGMGTLATPALPRSVRGRGAASPLALQKYVHFFPYVPLRLIFRGGVLFF